MTAPIFTTGQLVQITYRGRTVDGAVALASSNGKSLMLTFDAMLGGFVGAMPVLMDEQGVFRDLLEGKTPVTIEPLARH